MSGDKLDIFGPFAASSCRGRGPASSVCPDPQPLLPAAKPLPLVSGLGAELRAREAAGSRSLRMEFRAGEEEETRGRRMCPGTCRDKHVSGAAAAEGRGLALHPCEPEPDL